MSFFLGLAKGFMWAQEKKQEKEMFEAEMAWEREKLLLSAKLSRQNASYSANLKTQEETSTRLRLGTLMFGGDDRAEAIALTLEKQGVLGTILDKAEKDKIDVTGIVDTYRNMLPSDEDVAIAAEAAAMSGKADDTSAFMAGITALQGSNAFEIIQDHGLEGRTDSSALRSYIRTQLEKYKPETYFDDNGQAYLPLNGNQWEQQIGALASRYSDQVYDIWSRGDFHDAYAEADRLIAGALTQLYKPAEQVGSVGLPTNTGSTGGTTPVMTTEGLEVRPAHGRNPAVVQPAPVQPTPTPTVPNPNITIPGVDERFQ